MLGQALILNAVILLVILHADLGRSRKIGALRILRPLLTAAAIVPMFIEAVATHGTGLALEIGATAAGVLLGLAATRLMSVRLDHDGRPVSSAGAGYAGLWIVVIAARTLFSIGATHWFNHALGTWMVTNQVSSAAVTDSLILMAIAMTTTRTLGLVARTRQVTRRSATVLQAAA